jgi:hypothetical protein
MIITFFSKIIIAEHMFFCNRKDVPKIEKSRQWSDGMKVAARCRAVGCDC